MCLHTPLVEHATPLAQELLAARQRFLSKLIYQTYNGYVMSQFKKLEQDLRARGEIKWKHAMHLMRLLLSGISALREGELRVRLDEHRAALLAIKRGSQPWPEVKQGAPRRTAKVLSLQSQGDYLVSRPRRRARMRG